MLSSTQKEGCAAPLRLLHRHVSRKRVFTRLSSPQVPARHAQLAQPVGEAGGAGGRREGGRERQRERRRVRRGDGGPAPPRDLLRQAPLLPQREEPHGDLRHHRLRHHRRHLYVRSLLSAQTRVCGGTRRLILSRPSLSGSDHRAVHHPG